MSFLILDSIRKKIDGNPILNGCYLKFSKGTITSLVGRNGSGKSTLLKIAAGQLSSDEGLTVINGTIYHNPQKFNRYKRIAYLPQKSFLNKHQQVNIYLDHYNGKKVSDSFIESIRNCKIDKLSLGDRRYLEIVLILLLDRDYFLLDEPFSGLEPIRIETIIQMLISKKNAGKGVLLSDHYHHYVKQISDHTYLMEDGICKPIE